jgi:hypothetical protein
MWSGTGPGWRNLRSSATTDLDREDWTVSLWMGSARNLHISRRLSIYVRLSNRVDGDWGSRVRASCKVDLIVGHVILKAKALPQYSFGNLVDVMIVFDGQYDNLVNPQVREYSVYEHLLNVGPNHGMKLMLPQPSMDLPLWKFGAIVTGFMSNSARDTKLAEMADLLYDLVQMKRISAIFITDVEGKDVDGNKNWSLVWEEFVGMLAAAKMRCSILY